MARRFHSAMKTCPPNQNGGKILTTCPCFRAAFLFFLRFQFFFSISNPRIQLPLNFMKKEASDRATKRLDLFFLLLQKSNKKGFLMNRRGCFQGLHDHPEKEKFFFVENFTVKWIFTILEAPKQFLFTLTLRLDHFQLFLANRRKQMVSPKLGCEEDWGSWTPSPSFRVGGRRTRLGIPLENLTHCGGVHSKKFPKSDSEI